ncbi:MULTISPECIES: hypothetical protein [Halolamina]|uniref:Uncharacterized protein n=1 Tax=Halolamina pelagica TaxID=699431 RepID=A0A1I5WAS3_9EURY|nr:MULTISPECIES: hypothetical protein [Halolamina]NHX37955.1 hypothetical protein [Halolamina sp. R1-12]SFQ16830.1 hypothetical protein SAMN05216277_1263 [Halolamina pelagica]
MSETSQGLDRGVDLASRRVRMPLTVLLVGVVAGCWVGYVLVHPVSSLPLPRFTVVGVVVLGIYIDMAAEQMGERLFGVVAAGFISYVVGFVVYAFPALMGWYADPVVRRAIYFRGLREVFIFALLAATLLLVGTFVSYILRNTYAEITR